MKNEKKMNIFFRKTNKTDTLCKGIHTIANETILLNKMMKKREKGKHMTKNDFLRIVKHYRMYTWGRKQNPNNQRILLCPTLIYLFLKNSIHLFLVFILFKKKNAMY